MSLHLKPNPDKKVDGNPVSVPDPITGEPLPEDGKVVPKSTYWVRRLQCSDVIHVTEDTDTNSETEKKSAVKTPVPSHNVDVEPKEKPQDSNGESDEPKMTLEEAIAHCLEQGGDKYLTNAGKPDCNVLSELTGTKVKAADREAAMPKQEG